MQILNYQPHQKLGIPPGIISLIFLPVLCLTWLYFNGAFKKYSSLDVVFLDDDYNNRAPHLLELPMKKDYLDIEITGDPAEDRLSLEYAKLMLKRWKLARDDDNGIDIHFDKKAKYWTFIESLNIFKEVDLKTFVPYKDHIYAHWVFKPLPIDTTIKPVPCAGVFFTDTFSPAEPTLIQRSLHFLSEFWAPLVLFMAMTISVVVRTLKMSHKVQF